MKSYIPTFEEHLSIEEERMIEEMRGEFNSFMNTNHMSRLIEALISDGNKMMNDIEKFQ